MVTTIGVCYNEYARQELDPMENIGLSIQQTGRNIGSKYTITSSGIQAALISNNMSNLRKKAMKSATTEEGKERTNTTMKEELSLEGLNTEEQAAFKKYMTEMSLKMFTVMWAVTELDIRHTLAQVCKKVTHDHSVDGETRKLRMKGLELIGSVFIECGGSTEAGMGDIINRMTTANNQGFNEQQQQQEGKEKEKKEAN